jgi:hypothetical protein
MGKNLEKTQTTIWTQRISTNSETKLRRLLKKETNEIKKIVHYKELNKDMEILKKKKTRNPGNNKFLSQIKNTVESHCGRLGK